MFSQVYHRNVVVEREFDILCGDLRGLLQVKRMVKSSGETSGMGYYPNVAAEPYIGFWSSQPPGQGVYSLSP